jgi:hypothetical protein
MNSKPSPASLRLLALLAILLALCAGCLEQRIVWSPDGSRALVLGDHGLYLCDADGRISPLLMPDVTTAAWLNNSEITLVRRREATDWTDIARSIGEESKPIEAQAEDLWRRLQAGGQWGILTPDLGNRLDVVKVCLRDQHAADLTARLTDSEWRDLQTRTVSLAELLTARVEKDRIVAETILYTHFRGITDIRPTHDGSAVAWTQEMATKQDFAELMVVSLATVSHPVRRVAEDTAGYPDWDYDGRSLMYVEAAVTNENKEDTIVLGVVTKRGVLGSGREIDVAEKPEYLAGVVFNPLIHVRCLRDGRILFNAVELSLPASAADYGGDRRDQLFALDPAHQATLVRLIPRQYERSLPQSLSFFAVSPDDRQVVIGGMENEVALLTIATGEVTLLQEGAKKSYKGVPVWRRAGEVTYVKRTQEKSGGLPARPAEIVLATNGRETILSRSWPDAVLADIAAADRE